MPIEIREINEEKETIKKVTAALVCVLLKASKEGEALLSSEIAERLNQNPNPEVTEAIDFYISCCDYLVDESRLESIIKMVESTIIFEKENIRKLGGHSHSYKGEIYYYIK